MAVLDQQVGRLDVTVGEPGVPQPAYECEALVDDLVVDLGVADLDRAIEELGDEHVLTLRRQLDDSQRRRRRDTGIAHDPERVVLVLDQPPDGLERGLVLEPAVEDGAPGLVPAVGADVVHRVELPEDVRVGVAGEPQQQRGRSARSGEPDRADIDDGDAELVLDGAAKGLATASSDVEVGRLAAVVLHREHVVGGEESEREERDGDAQSHAGERIEGMVHGEVEARTRRRPRRRRCRWPWRSHVVGRARRACTRSRRP